MRWTDRRCRRRWPFTLLLALLTLGSTTPSIAQEWVEVRSSHFRVISDQPLAAVEPVVADLEQMREVFVTGLPYHVADPFRPVVVVLVKGPEAFTTWLPQFEGSQVPGGAFFNGPFAHYLVLQRNEGRRIVYHEYLHLVTGLRDGRLPRWLSEGLADFYANTRFGEARVTFGQTYEASLDHLRRLSRLPIASLLQAEGDPHRTSDTEALRTFYALSWALTHYLMVGRDQVTPGSSVVRYIDHVQRGVDPIEAFERAIGPISEVERELRGHLRRLLFPVLEVPAMPVTDLGPLRARSLATAEVLADRAVVLASCGHRSEAADLIHRAEALDPGSPVVATASGQVSLLRKDEPAARVAFGEAIRQQATSFVPYFASAILATGPDGTPDHPERVRLLRHATRLFPRFVPAHVELAKSLAWTDDLERALRAARTAVALDPARGSAWALLGRLALRAGDIAGARRAADRGFSWARSEESRHRLRVFANQIVQHEKRRASNVG